MKRPFFYLLAFVMTVSVISCKKDKGEKATTSDAGQVKNVEAAASYKVNPAASKILWEGYKPTGTHNGTVNVTEGVVEVTNGKLAAGKFVIDMNSINVLDLAGDDKANLESHLKGLEDKKADDFFNVAVYPTGSFEITKVVDLKDADGYQMVYGNLTLKDKTHQTGFKAKATVTGNAVTVTAPKFNIDRTKWDIKYGSKTLFKDLGDKFINDEIGLTITLAANK